jgi:threonyl-tRNA synthetase
VGVHIANFRYVFLSLELFTAMKNQAYFTESHVPVALRKMMRTFIAQRNKWWASLIRCLHFVLNLLRDYGLNEFYLELSTKNEEKFVGDDADWAEATDALRKAATAQNLELVLDEGGAAFYGPKISVQAKDAIGRTWQMSTIQVDFQLPQRFELEYSATDGTRQRPVMIHRALFGSIERFFGVLTEHYSGAFPPWLAPVQAIGIPVADSFSDYLGDVIKQMRKAGIRAELDASDDRMQKKVRNAQMQKIPFMVIAGEEDQKAGAVSFRYRNGEQKNGIPIADAIAGNQKGRCATNSGVSNES